MSPAGKASALPLFSGGAQAAAWPAAAADRPPSGDGDDSAVGLGPRPPIGPLALSPSVLPAQKNVLQDKESVPDPS